MMGDGAVERGYEPMDPLHASLMGLERVRTLLLHHHESKGPARMGAAHQRKPGGSGLPVCPLSEGVGCEDKRRGSPRPHLGDWMPRKQENKTH